MKSLLLILVLVVYQYGKCDVPPKLLLSVYYESKCPDSKRFIVEQLVPAMNMLQDHLVLRLVPFGKAHSIDNGNSGFKCQHGQTECLGNRVQDCALNYMQDRTDYEKVSYVACEMLTLAGTTGDLMCVHNSKLPVELIQQCVNSDEGTELQLISEYATKLVNPKFIPTATTNNEFNQQIQDHAQEDLVGTLCSLLKDFFAQACAAHYNQNALQSVLS